MPITYPALLPWHDESAAGWIVVYDDAERLAVIQCSKDVDAAGNAWTPESYSDHWDSLSGPSLAKGGNAADRRPEELARLLLAGALDLSGVDSEDFAEIRRRIAREDPARVFLGATARRHRLPQELRHCTGLWSISYFGEEGGAILEWDGRTAAMILDANEEEAVRTVGEEITAPMSVHLLWITEDGECWLWDSASINAEPA